MVRRACRGFTVLEVSLVMLLTFLLLGLVSMFLLRGKHYAAETEVYSSAQRTANAILRKITDDVYHSTVEHIKVTSGSVVFLSFEPSDPDQPFLDLEPNSGKIRWKKWVGFYHNDDEQTVYRGELALHSVLSNLDDTPSPIVEALDFKVSPDVSRQPLPGKVSEFSVARIDDRIRVQLTTREEASIVTNNNPDQRVVTVSVQADVALLN